ncbi:hypothetical protein EYR36_002330 [Pleurotus pulmonarius]|nr:hypothetical protein EYR36_002330 [Pleurotus pulmonarius]
MPRKATKTSKSTTPRSAKKVAVPAPDVPTNVTPPTSVVAVTVPPTPRPKRVSPKKLATPSDAPAVQISGSLHIPPVGRRLSFGTASNTEADPTPVSSQTVVDAPLSSSAALFDDDNDVDQPSALGKVVETVDAALDIEEDTETTPTQATPKASDAKRKRAASTASPSPNRPATGAKKPVILSPDERKAARMANPAKRRKAIDRIDSDDEYPSRMQATATSQDSPVPPETPTRAAIERDLVLFMDNEAEEDNDIADDWNSPSPSPSQSLAGLPAKSVERSVERKGKASPQGKVVRIGHVDNPILLDMSDDEEDKKTAGSAVHTHDQPTFPEIPSLFDGIVSALKSSGILRQLRTSELVPKYTAQDSEEGLVPDVLHVMGCMVDEYAAVSIYDALLFRGRGMYVNPLIANPRDFTIFAKRVVFASGSRAPAVFVMPVVVESCALLNMVPVNRDDMHLRLNGWMFDEMFGLFSCFVGSLFNSDLIYAYMNNCCLQFSSRFHKADSQNNSYPGGSAPSTPQRTSKASAAFKVVGSSRNKARQDLSASALTIRYPSSLAATDTIPIHDGRLGRGNFRFNNDDWDRLPSMIRYGVPTPAAGELPDNSHAQELPSSKGNKFVVALVGFTIGTFNPKENPTATAVSFNLQFSILLGLYKALDTPRKFNLRGALLVSQPLPPLSQLAFPLMPVTSRIICALFLAAATQYLLTSQLRAGMELIPMQYSTVEHGTSLFRSLMSLAGYSESQTGMASTLVSTGHAPFSLHPFLVLFVG